MAMRTMVDALVEKMRGEFEMKPDLNLLHKLTRLIMADCPNIFVARQL